MNWPDFLIKLAIYLALLSIGVQLGSLVEAVGALR